MEALRNIGKLDVFGITKLLEEALRDGKHQLAVYCWLSVENSRFMLSPRETIRRQVSDSI